MPYQQHETDESPTDLTPRLTEDINDTFVESYKRGFREGWHLDELRAWLDEEIEVCDTQCHGSTDLEEWGLLVGMVEAYEDAARFLEARGVSVMGES